MPILNYTTTIAVDKTMGEITRLLSSHGARRVMIDYDGQGNPQAVAFRIVTPFGEQAFRLPANLDGVWRVLTNQHEAGKVQPRFATREQAARVGWRIIKDWLGAQMAIIEAGVASADEVFFPYLLSQDGRTTAYEVFTDRQMPLLLPAAQEG